MQITGNYRKLQEITEKLQRNYRDTHHKYEEIMQHFD
jgi:hypothetical protein